MQKFYKLVWLFLLAPFAMNAQLQLPNAGFETWQNVGSATEEPTNWNSNKTGSGFASLGPQTCRREATIVHSGSYSVKLNTLSSGFGSNVNGVVTVGRVNAPSTTPSAGYNDTQQANASFNAPFTGRPDSIVFWAYYSPGTGDSARVSVLLHTAYDQRDPTSNDPNGATNVIGTAIKNFRTASSWVRMSVPFTYSSAATPSYALATFTSSKVPGGGSTSTILYVDDVSMIYNPQSTCGPISPLTYYVSASQGASISVPYTLNSAFGSTNTVTAQLSNSSGSFASPVSLGSLANTNTSGTLVGTIPAGTATGSGYRVRVNNTNPAFNSSDNGANIQIYLVSNSILPTASQVIEAGVNGTTLNVTESVASTSREWKYATVSGGPYTSFAPAETGTSYVPNFSTSGTYYVVCESNWPGSLMTRSNEVVINVVDNAVTPSGSQSLLVGANGNLLTVTETPSGTAREWKWSTVSGGPYNSFGPLMLNMTYLPNFGAPGSWYIVCVSTISGIQVTSNEVLINVSNATITTGTVTGSPFEFSPSAPSAAVNVPFTTNGSFNAGNVFTAQLSDASGSFASPVNIGTLSGTTSGTISAGIVNTTGAGTGYRIRVVSNNPGVQGSDNGTDLVVDQFSNSISPTAQQTILFNTNGTALTVAPSQTATHQWMSATISGGPYANIAGQTSASYTPNFPAPGTYYVVCVSTNQYNDPVTSNEVEIVVTNGSTLTTDAVTDPFYVSPNANVTVNVTFTTDIYFNPGNVFTAEISDLFGSFAAPVTIGTLSSATPGTINCTIPNSLNSGTGYRIRVLSSDPVTTGGDNGSDLEVVQLANNVAPDSVQNLPVSTAGVPIVVTCTHPGVTQVWKWRTFFALPADFIPAETGTSYTPIFATPESYIVQCLSINMWGDTAQSQEVTIVVTDPNAVTTGAFAGQVAVYAGDGLVHVNLGRGNFTAPLFELLDAQGKVIAVQQLTNAAVQEIPAQIPAGIYVWRLTEGEKWVGGKVLVH